MTNQPAQHDTDEMMFFEVCLLLWREKWVFLLTLLICLGLSGLYVAHKTHRQSTFIQVVRLGGVETFLELGDNPTRKNLELGDNPTRKNKSFISFRAITFPAFITHWVNQALRPVGLVSVTNSGGEIQITWNKGATQSAREKLFQQIQRMESDKLHLLSANLTGQLQYARNALKKANINAQHYTELLSDLKGEWSDKLRVYSQLLIGSDKLEVERSRIQQRIARLQVTNVRPARVLYAYEHTTAPSALKYVLFGFFASLFLALSVAFIAGILRHQARILRERRS